MTNNRLGIKPLYALKSYLFSNCRCTRQYIIRVVMSTGTGRSTDLHMARHNRLLHVCDETNRKVRLLNGVLLPRLVTLFFRRGDTYETIINPKAPFLDSFSTKKLNT